MFKKHKREAITLRRDLGLFDATLAGIGIIIGAGIYVLIGVASGHAGNAVWLSFIIAAFVAFLTGMSYAELSSIYTEDSGEYSYVEHNFGKKLAFVTGYLVTLSLIVGAAAVSLGFAGYLNSLLGLNNLLLTAASAIVLFSLVNFIGIRQSMGLNRVFTGLSITGLLAIIVLSFSTIGSVDYFDMPSLSGVFKSASLIFFAYIGFESVIKLSEETKNPRRNIPLALVLALIISTALYILVALASVSAVGWEALSASKSPLADVAFALMGPQAALVVAFIAIVSTGNTILLSLIALSRMIYSMSQNYIKLKFLSAVNKLTKTPYLAIIFAAIVTCAFATLGNIETVAEITNFSVFTVFAIINITLIKSRYKKHRHERFRSPLNIGKFPVLALLGFIASILMMLNLELEVLLFGIIMIISGLVFYKVLES
jgi:basic amino acid/polyamine antiporter, APA family